MSRCSERHLKLNEHGEGLCSVPMFDIGGDAGFCDRRAFGERPPGRKYRDAWTGETYRFDGLYNGYIPGLACPAHGGPNIRTFMDGDAWCAVRPDFINLQESPAGFGATREEAIKKLEVKP